MQVIEKSSSVPIHVQLRKILLEMVEGGKIRAGERLFSEAELCRKFAISRMTVRKVIDDLAKEGYLYRVPGKGTFVSRPKIVEKLAYLVTFTEDMFSRGMKPGCYIYEREVEEPCAKISEILNLGRDEKIIRLKRLLFADQEPICIQEVFLPLKLFHQFLKVTNREIENQDLCEILNAFIARPVAWARQTLSAVALSREEEEALNVPSGFPGLLCERVTYDETDLPIEYVTFLYRSDRYTFMIDLVKPNLNRITPGITSREKGFFNGQASLGSPLGSPSKTT
ncbi:MAG TPA: GntR family transcriptional regulator [Atribacteraceae bacterium]|nr:GntR family transcriptional regulator [Atribacteraceae bacterium]